MPSEQSIDLDLMQRLRDAGTDDELCGQIIGNECSSVRSALSGFEWLYTNRRVSALYCSSGCSARVRFGDVRPDQPERETLLRDADPDRRFALRL